MSFIASEIRRQARALSDLQRRIAASHVAGKVTDVDHATRRVRLEIGTDDKGAPVKSPWLRWAEAAVGSLKIHTPPIVGQQMAMVSPGGVMGDGSYAVARSFDDDNAAPASGPDAAVLDFGGVRLAFGAGGLTVTGGLTVNGGTITNDGKDVGHAHTHQGVMAGPDPSGPPS